MYTIIIIGIMAVIFTFLYDKNICNWGFWVAMSLLTVFCAIRWNWGNDMPSYELSFEKIENFTIKQLFAGYLGGDRDNEYGWLLLNFICQPIGFFGMTILLSVFEGGFIYLFIKTYVPRDYFTIAIFLYVFNSNLMILGCSMMRQYLAMCIILIAIHFLVKNRVVLFLLLTLLASLFHTSSLICCIFYFLCKLRDVKMTTSKTILFFGFAIIWTYIFRFFVFDIGQNIISTYFGLYETYMEGESIATVGFASFINILLSILCLYSLKRANYNTKSLTWIYVGYIIFLPFVATISMGARILFYFDIIMIAVIPNLLANLREQTLLKYISLAWVLFWNLYTFVLFFNNNIWHESYTEYHTILEAPYWK